MFKTRPHHLGDLSTDAIRDLLASGPVVALLPVGSVEPHGPHLPLATDTLISEGAAGRAIDKLAEAGVRALVAPSIPYGVTRFAEGFAGAITVRPDALTAFVASACEAYLATGFAHVCVVNNHLEPAQDEAIRRAADDDAVKGRVSVACPLKRRWARTLSPEFKSGACHAGSYETSLVLAVAPELVDHATANALPARTTSLSDGIRDGRTSFLAMGLDRAYTGSPASASFVEGEAMLDRLAEMIATEVREALASRANTTKTAEP